jgi:hypothetical protein
LVVIFLHLLPFCVLPVHCIDADDFDTAERVEELCGLLLTASSSQQLMPTFLL